MVCPKCKSDQVNVQAVSITKTRHHGIAWWLFVGWWWWILWMIAFIPMLIIRLIRGKRVKTKVHSEAVCQSCGHRWKVA